MARPESEFPTIRDLRDGLSGLVERGLGDHPVQVVVIPSSTMHTIARAMNGPDCLKDGRPPLMLELVVDKQNRIPVVFVSTDYLNGARRADH